MTNNKLPRERLNRKPDFCVKYSYIDDQPEQAIKLYQGIRSDFCFADDYDKRQLYIIWPEFIHASGEPISANSEAEKQGLALMYILFDESRDEIRAKLKEGVRGFIVMGSRKIALAEVESVYSD